MAADKVSFSLPTAQQVMEKLALAEAEQGFGAFTQASSGGSREKDAAGKAHQAVWRVAVSLAMTVRLRFP
jgi:hypothetical protein